MHLCFLGNFLKNHSFFYKIIIMHICFFMKIKIISMYWPRLILCVLLNLATLLIKISTNKIKTEYLERETKTKKTNGSVLVLIKKSNHSHSAIQILKFRFCQTTFMFYSKNLHCIPQGKKLFLLTVDVFYKIS